MTVEDTYREGDAVEARHRGGKNYYPGRINKVNNGGGTYAVDYDDGDKETHVKPGLIRRRQGSATTAGASHVACWGSATRVYHILIHASVRARSRTRTKFSHHLKPTRARSR